MFCFLVWCLNCPLLQPAEVFHGLCLTIIDFDSHSPSCAFSTLALCSLEESRPVSGITGTSITLVLAGSAPSYEFTCSSAQTISGGQRCHPYLEHLALSLLLGFQQYSRVVEADPTLIAVRGAVSAADWLQVPWASYPDRAILPNAARILAAINLRAQHRISPNVGSLMERNPHAVSHRPSACSSCREVNYRYYFESAQAVRRSISSLQEFLITLSCRGPGEAQHGGRIAVGEMVPNKGSW